jgi:hypothetical protein
VPNIAFIYYRLLHLLWKWEYAAPWVGGVMDFTHLRFFTFHSMYALLEEAWYRVDLAEWLNVVRDRYAFLRYLGKIWPNMWAIQVVYKIYKK